MSYFLPFYCHPTQCSCFQSIMYQWDRQTRPTFDLVYQLTQNPEMCLPQFRQSTNDDRRERRKGATWKKGKFHLMWSFQKNNMSHSSFTLCETGSNCPKSCPIVIDFGFKVLKMTFSLSVCPLLFMRVIVSARTCKTLVFPAKGSPTSIKLWWEK